MFRTILPKSKPNAISLTNVHQLKVQLQWHPQLSLWAKFLKQLGLLHFHFFDLDLVAFLLKGYDKLENLGDEKLAGGDVIFFNSPKHFSGHIWLDRDSRTGGEKGYDECITINLDLLSSHYQKVVFLLSLHKGISQAQDLGQLKDGKLQVIDEKGKVWAEIALHDATFLKGKCTFLFLELHRNGKNWEYTLPKGTFSTDNFANVLQNYIYY
ncbi:MAG: TerD family protein [Bacteroidia bacterium]